jgi:integrase
MKPTTSLQPAVDRPLAQGLQFLALQWKGPRAPRYTESLLTFLAGFDSEHTRRAYSYSVLLFWRWCRWKLDQNPLPHQITRAHALSFAQWLSTRTDELHEQLLEEDPRRVDELAIYRTARRHPGVTGDGLEKALHKPVGALLVSMMKRRLLRRHRTGYAPYSAPRGPAGPARSSTVTLRLAALSSFWRSLAEESADNRPGHDRPLLEHNIWLRPLRTASKQSPSRKRAARAAKTPDEKLLIKLLSATYPGLRRARALGAAESCLDGRPSGRPDGCTPSIYDLRDRALIVLLATTGLRVSEVAQIRRRDVGPNHSLLTIVGKGGTTRMLQVPSAAQRALVDYQALLDVKIAEGTTTGRLRKLDFLDDPDGPLLASLRWRRMTPFTPPDPENIDGMTPTTIVTVLRKRARQAGLKMGSANWVRIHPHGLRHLAAAGAVRRGVPLPVIRAVLGHESLATTGQYLEQIEPERLTLVPETL